MHAGPLVRRSACNLCAFVRRLWPSSDIIAVMFARLRKYLRRRTYKTGSRLTQFLAPDVRREVEIVDASEVEDGYVIARIRTWNLLYVARGMAAVPELSAPRRVAITDLWTWTGQLWGGPVPDDDISRPNPDD